MTVNPIETHTRVIVIGNFGETDRASLHRFLKTQVEPVPDTSSYISIGDKRGVLQSVVYPKRGTGKNNSRGASHPVVGVDAKELRLFFKSGAALYKQAAEALVKKILAPYKTEYAQLVILFAPEVCVEAQAVFKQEIEKAFKGCRGVVCEFPFISIKAVKKTVLISSILKVTTGESA